MDYPLEHMAPIDGRTADIELLREHLRSERVEEREAALRRVNSTMRDALRPELRRLLADPSARVRHHAVEALGSDKEAPGAWDVTLEAALHGRRDSSRR